MVKEKAPQLSGIRELEDFFLCLPESKDFLGGGYCPKLVPCVFSKVVYPLTPHYDYETNHRGKQVHRLNS